LSLRKIPYKSVIFLSLLGVVTILPSFINKGIKIPVLEIARKYLGLKELPGSRKNEVITEMYSSFGYPYDENTHWCVLFLNLILREGSYCYMRTLWVFDYLKYPGKDLTLEELKPGDIVILGKQSPGSIWGHIGFFVERSDNIIYILGGNQAESVNIAGFRSSDFIAGKKPLYKKCYV